MLKFWFWVYNLIFLPLLWTGFRAVSLINNKVRDGFKGRKNIFDDIKTWSYTGGKRIIIHSSSLGEYQQAMPIVNELRELGYNIILTFFSPSGFKNSKVPFADVRKTYIPFDSYSKVKKFLEEINPDMIILMRYDLWFNFLYRAKKRNVKVIIANARYDENDIFWKFPIISSFKKTMYGFIDIMFAIDESDFRNYSELMEGTHTQIIQAGDSKFERVVEASKNIKMDDLLKPEVYKDKKVFVIGSSWKDDEDVILPVINKIRKYEKNLLTILVPHEPKETKIEAIEKNIGDLYSNLKSIRYSKIENYTGENVIIVDCIGKLMGLYSIAHVAYIGGGFRTGLHNVLEPAVFNIPVFYSNKVKNSDEDEILTEKGCGIVIETRNGFYREFRKVLSDKDYYDKLSCGCMSVFKDNLGTTKKIIQNITN
jgi:3-deoxy-D-manno-octulosonic-acid transferase